MLHQFICFNLLGIWGIACFEAPVHGLGIRGTVFFGWDIIVLDCTELGMKTNSGCWIN